MSSITKSAATPANQADKQTTPTFLRDDFPYQTIGGNIANMDTLFSDCVYEIRCPSCEMRIRAQGQKLCSLHEKLVNTGCLNCSGRSLIVNTVDMEPESKEMHD